jgi:beta/gamma crystallin
MSKATMRGQLTLLSVLVALAPLAGAGAQEQRIGGGVGITVFTGSDFSGKAVTFQRDMPNLRADNLNDQIASLRVARGEQWEVCEHANFRGRCVVVSGDERNLARNSWANTISSMRRVRTAAGVLPAPLPDITLFDQPGFRGRSANFTAATASLPLALPAAKSVTVGRGVWELCDGRNFTGRCITVQRNTPLLGGTRPLTRVRSLRPLTPQAR